MKQYIHMSLIVLTTSSLAYARESATNLSQTFRNPLNVRLSSEFIYERPKNHCQNSSYYVGRFVGLVSGGITLAVIIEVFIDNNKGLPKAIKKLIMTPFVTGLALRYGADFYGNLCDGKTIGQAFSQSSKDITSSTAQNRNSLAIFGSCALTSFALTQTINPVVLDEGYDKIRTSINKHGDKFKGLTKIFARPAVKYASIGISGALVGQYAYTAASNILKK